MRNFISVSTLTEPEGTQKNTKKNILAITKGRPVAWQDMVVATGILGETKSTVSEVQKENKQITITVI